MPTTYELAGDAVEAVMRKCMQQHHVEIATLGVSVGCLFAFNPDGPAVTKTGGYPAAAKVRIVSLKDRAAGMPDAQVIIDQTVWKDLDAEERFALMDHELEHLMPRLKDGKPVRDDLDRPKLCMKKHDAEVGIFKSIIERHGMKALDAQIAKGFIHEYKQLVLWAEEPAQVG